MGLGCSMLVSVNDLGLVEALHRAQAELERLRERHAQLQAELAETAQEGARLGAMVKSLQDARAFFGVSPEEASPLEPEESSVVDEEGWLSLGRGEAVERVLRESSVAMSPKEIVEYLRSKGRDDEAPVVSASLSHLARRNKVFSSQRGQWRHQEPSDLPQELAFMSGGNPPEEVHVAS